MFSTEYRIQVFGCTICWIQVQTKYHSFIHSGHFYSTSSSPLLLRGAHDYSTDTVSEFHAETHRQSSVSKGLAQGPYMAARAGVEPATLRLRVIDLTIAPPRPTIIIIIILVKYTV